MSVSSMKTIVNHLKTSNNVKLKVPIFAVLILAFLQRNYFCPSNDAELKVPWN